MLRHPQSHRWRPMLRAMYPLPKQQAQGAMSPLKIVIEELQANECIPGHVPFGKRMGLARERIEPIAQRAVEPFHMHSPGWSYAESQRGTDLHRQEVPMLITLLDGLRQRHCLAKYSPRAPAFSRQLPPPIGSPKDGDLPLPPRGPPRRVAVVVALQRRG